MNSFIATHSEVISFINPFRAQAASLRQLGKLEALAHTIAGLNTMPHTSAALHRAHAQWCEELGGSAQTLGNFAFSAATLAEAVTRIDVHLASNLKKVLR